MEEQKKHNPNPKGINEYTPEEKEAKIRYVFSRIEKGMSIFNAVKDDFDSTKNVISVQTFYNWIKNPNNFLVIDNDKVSWMEEYLRVSAVRTDILAEEVIEIADKEHTSTKVVETDKGTYVTTYDNTERSKLKMNARIWLAGKQQPKKYGNQPETEDKGHVEQPLFNDIG